MTAFSGSTRKLLLDKAVARITSRTMNFPTAEKHKTSNLCGNEKRKAGMLDEKRIWNV